MQIIVNSIKVAEDLALQRTIDSHNLLEHHWTKEEIEKVDAIGKTEYMETYRYYYDFYFEILTNAAINLKQEPNY